MKDAGGIERTCSLFSLLFEFFVVKNSFRIMKAKRCFILIPWASLLITRAAFAGAAEAQCIGIEVSGADAADPAGKPLPAGVVPQIHWNHLGAVSGTLAAIADNTGATLSGASAVWGVNGNSVLYDYDSNFSNPGDNNLYSYSIVTIGNDPGTPWGIHITLSGIPYASYDVYAYFYGSREGSGLVNLNGALGGASGIAGGKSLKFVQMCGAPMTGYVAATGAGGPANYAVFPGVTGATATVNFQGNNGGIAGIQIVSQRR